MRIDNCDSRAQLLRFEFGSGGVDDRGCVEMREASNGNHVTSDSFTGVLSRAEMTAVGVGEVGNRYNRFGAGQGHNDVGRLVDEGMLVTQPVPVGLPAGGVSAEKMLK